MNPAAQFRIREAQFPEDLEIVRELLRQYREPLRHTVCLAGSDQEIADLPGDYARERGGALLLAHDGDGMAAGMVALRRLDESNAAEIKRLYVRKAARGQRAGEALVLEMVEQARALGYRTLRLETLPTMFEAIALYRRNGFREAGSAPDVLAFEMDLASAAAPLPRSPQEPPTLRTARLVLRPLDLGDEEWVAELASHRSIGRNTLSIPHPYPPGAALRFLEQVRSGYPRTGSCAFAVIVDETGEKAGAAGLTVDSRNRKAELGYWIGQPYWGRGYATEAAAGLLPLGFETLGLKRIFARVFGSNPASARVLEKIGLQFEGRLRGHLLKWGEFEDILMYGLLREEWTGDSGMTVPKPLAGR